MLTTMIDPARAWLTAVRPFRVGPVTMALLRCRAGLAVGRAERTPPRPEPTPPDTRVARSEAKAARCLNDPRWHQYGRQAEAARDAGYTSTHAAHCMITRWRKRWAARTAGEL